MAYICEKPEGSCSSCPHFRYDYDNCRFACFAATDEATGYAPVSDKKRRVIAVFDVDDAQAEKLGFGTIDYFEAAAGLMQTSGIKLIDSRVLDDDDPEDAEAIKHTKHIF